MSTRCNIHFNYGIEAAANVYRHCDGYPDTESGVLASLQKFFADVEEQTPDTRFNDPEYLAAKFVVWQAERYARSPEKRLDFLSVGICLGDRPDIEYVYDVDCNNLDQNGRPTVTYTSV